MIETIAAIQKPDFVELDFDSEMMEFNQKMIFSESNGKTSLKTESLVKGKGIVMRSMFTIMESLSGAFTAQETENIEALKKLLKVTS